MGRGRRAAAGAAAPRRGASDSDLPQLVSALQGGGQQAIAAASVCVTRCQEMYDRLPAVEALVAELTRLGALGPAVRLLAAADRGGDADDLFWSCWLVGHLCEGQPANAAAAVAAGCLPVLARLCDSPDDGVADNAMPALMHIAQAPGGRAHAAARLVARRRGTGGQGMQCALRMLRAAIGKTGSGTSDRVAAVPGALAAVVEALEFPDDDVAEPAMDVLRLATGESAAAQRAVALDPAAVPALVRALMAAPAGGLDHAAAASPYLAADVLGLLAGAATGRFRPGAAHADAVTAEVRRAGGVRRTVELVRAAQADAAPAALRPSYQLCQAYAVRALATFLLADAAARPEALAAGALPAAAGALTGAFGPRGGACSEAPAKEALICLLLLAPAKPGGRAALAAAPGLAAAAVRMIGASLADGVKPGDARYHDRVVSGAAALLFTMLAAYDQAGAAAAKEVARAGGAPLLVRLRGRPWARRGGAAPPLPWASRSLASVARRPWGASPCVWLFGACQPFGASCAACITPTIARRPPSPTAPHPLAGPRAAGAQRRRPVRSRALRQGARAARRRPRGAARGRRRGGAVGAAGRAARRRRRRRVGPPPARREGPGRAAGAGADGARRRGRGRCEGRRL
jgi:hypothetical protein